MHETGPLINLCLSRVDETLFIEGYISAKGHTLVDMRLSLPQDWTQDKARLDKAGVPQARRGYRTRHQLALAMREQDGPALSHGWMALACQCGTIPRMLHERARRVPRNELARLYHLKQHNRLAPLNIDKRRF